MNPIDLLTTVNDFYDKAFSRLLITTFGIIAFIGVIIPIAVGWLQLRSLRSEKNSLLNELITELSSERQASERKMKEEVEAQIKLVKKDYEKQFIEMAASIKKSSASATARAHHLQGIATLEANLMDLGITDFSQAARQFFVAGEEDNARRAIAVICQQCLPKINAEQYNDHEIEKACDDLISEVQKHNDNSRYHDDIVLMKKEMRGASSRAK